MPQPFSVAVGAALRDARRAHGYSQSRLAREVGITQASYSNYENGKRDMPLLTVFCTATVLGIDPRDFFAALIKDVA